VLRLPGEASSLGAVPASVAWLHAALGDALPDLSEPRISTHAAHPHLPAAATLDGLAHRTQAEAALEPESPAAHRVGWGFISWYALAYMSTSGLSALNCRVEVLELDARILGREAPVDAPAGSVAR
jgi:hypothetical protein